MDNNYLEGLYTEFNEKYFENKLPRIPVTFAMLKKGLYGIAICRSRNKVIIPDTLEIKISERYNWTDEQLTKVLLHEMIHIERYVEKDLITTHGHHFQRVREVIEKRSGIEIPRDCGSFNGESFLGKKKPLVLIERITGDSKFYIFLKHKYYKENHSLVKATLNVRYMNSKFNIYEINSNLYNAYGVKNNLKTRGIGWYYPTKEITDEINTNTKPEEVSPFVDDILKILKDT